MKRPEAMPPAFEFSPNLAVLARSRSFMGWLDKVVRNQSHEIFNDIAMQQSQHYFARLGMRFTLVLLAAAPVQAATMAKPAKPDPLLDSGPSVPCAVESDYVPGTDVNGHFVPPADVAAGPVPLPDGISVPLHAGANRRGRPKASGEVPYVSLDGRRLEPLVNPKPCR